MTHHETDLTINTSTYDVCIDFFRIAKKLLNLNIKLHQHENAQVDATQMGDIFLFNHFARFETLIPQYLIHDATGAYCRSIASSEFFEDEGHFSQFLYSVGVVPNNLPGLFPFLLGEILRGRKVVVFPEGGMVKDKRVVDQHGKYGIYSRVANERRKHHRGSAVIALALDAFKIALLRDYSAGHYQRIERWSEQLEFDSVESLMVKVVKPTVMVPSHITFYPIRVSDNILHQAMQFFEQGNKRLAEELLIEGNLLLKNTDMDIFFAKPIIVGNYWRWWEKKLLPGIVHRLEDLDRLFELKPSAGHWTNRIHVLGLKTKSNLLRNDAMKAMYQVVTINLSHIASYLILSLFRQGLRQIPRRRFHKMLYMAIKSLQQSDSVLHRSLRNPEEYAAIVNRGSSRLNQFLKTTESMQLIKVDKNQYLLDEKLIKDFEIDAIRRENLISVYANEIAPLSKATKMIEQVIHRVDQLDPIRFAEYRYDDQNQSLVWDQQQFNKPEHAEINQQQTASADPEWFFLKSSRAVASAVLLIHGFLAGPAEMRSLGERLHAQGHHVLGVRLKGHGTSPWDLRSRSWEDWFDSVICGFDILKAYSTSIHVIGFSTGGLLALLLANRVHQKISSVSSISAPIDFINKNMKYVPLLHHANSIARWAFSEGLVPFQPNEPEHPEVNYQHIPVQALYQLRLLIEHITEQSLKIPAKVMLYQADADPVVQLSSVEKLYQLIQAEDKSKQIIHANRHGVVYENLDNIQERLCNSLAQLSC